MAAPVSLLDLAPTLLELAAIPTLGDLAEELDGVSLLDLVADGTGGRPGPVLGEYLAEGVTAPAVMIRDGRHKLVACEGDPDQLYDIAEDPAELVNLAAEPGHRPILAALRAELAARWDLGALRTRVVASQRERHLVERALEQGAYTSWDFEPSADASTRYVRSRADLYALQRRSRLEASAVGNPRLEAEDPSRYGHRGPDERNGA